MVIGRLDMHHAVSDGWERKTTTRFFQAPRHVPDDDADDSMSPFASFEQVLDTHQSDKSKISTQDVQVTVDIPVLLRHVMFVVNKVPELTSSSELPTASVSQLIETNDMHRTMSTTNLSHTESQAEELLQAVSIIESETSEAAQKRQVLKLFEWFKAQYAQLKGQVKDLQRHPAPPEKNPPKAVASRAASASTRYIEEDLSTFHEWKILNKVWSPSKSNARKADDLYWNNTPSTLGDRASVGFPVTPMERAMTTVPQSRKKQASASSRSSQRLPTV
ncbi:hypothetical protein DYB32_000644 [Aphanomyces invadans]|uniref:Uncharacterized protein n=1 Tax=Aphanomyces invadans TaxID=157072 RepID=A0A418B990_9STRA|nr:hypothetical protein DYB32_000644 [Aphanomyces invadans]